jgi:hypothetical protein
MTLVVCGIDHGIDGLLNGVNGLKPSFSCYPKLYTLQD